MFHHEPWVTTSNYLGIILIQQQIILILISRGTHPTHDLTIGWQNLNLLSHPNTTLVPQARIARASGENLNYTTLAPQARPSGEILNYLLSH